jgi:hypothetical protein
MYLNTDTSTLNNYEVFLPPLVQSLWNLGIQLKILYYSFLQLRTARKRPLLSPINLRRGPIENTPRGRYPLFYDVTAYAEVRLPSRCPETGCIAPFFYCCECVLLTFCGSTVLAWLKYATIHFPSLPWMIHALTISNSLIQLS